MLDNTFRKLVATWYNLRHVNNCVLLYKCELKFTTFLVFSVFAEKMAVNHSCFLVCVFYNKLSMYV